MIPTAVLARAWPPLAERAIPPCPYRGLSAFREQDSRFFFGRKTFTNLLEAAVGTHRPMLAVVGPSGSGKSSLVFAGLLPVLRARGPWLVADFRPGDRPLRALAGALVPLLETGMSETGQLIEINNHAEALERGRLSVRDVVERLRRKTSEAARVLLIVDQFEELYTLSPEKAVQKAFLDALLHGAQAERSRSDTGLTLLFTLRADFVGRALSYRPLADALQGRT